MTRLQHESSGFIVLLAVLIVGAVSLAMATLLLTRGIDTQKATLSNQQSVQARGLAGACAEEGLQQIRDNTSYIGTNNLNLGAGTCTYTVASAGASTRTVTVSAAVGAATRKTTAYATIGTSTISVTAWQDVQ
ncbi:MAG TPA: hypothetical protein VK694_07785 [Verrucomicrobiae bacterium]|nr:hypothetical protein [Verrucomicrobiae bacterium]